MSTTDPLIQSNAPIALRPSGRGREEISSLRRLSQLQPQDAAVWRRLGYAELASGEAQNAAASYRRAIELEPWNARGHNNLGQALMRLQQRAEAIACYRRATDLDPGHAAAHNNLGIASMRRVIPKRPWKATGARSPWTRSSRKHTTTMGTLCCEQSNFRRLSIVMSERSGSSPDRRR
jgi:tetratricopeptide (TPR) repeat protein